MMAVIGAIVLLVVYRAAFQRSPTAHGLYAPPGDADSTAAGGNRLRAWPPLPDHKGAAKG
jgi:hypothetical protein